MPAGRPAAVRRSAQAAPRISLLERNNADISPKIAAARDAALRTFVSEVQRQHGYWWPPGPVDRRSPARPWPECWEQHEGLVAALRMLKSWHDALEDGEADGGYREARDWLQYLRDDIGGLTRVISGRTCRYGHVDPATEEPVRGPEIQAPPPLPGQAPPPPPPPTPVHPGWTAFLGNDVTAADLLA
jgi:hypothetical protein